MPLNRDQRIREAFVVLSDAEVNTWLEVIKRSGRLKVTRDELLARVVLAFGIQSAGAEISMRRSLLKGVDVPTEAKHLTSVLAASQLIEFFDSPTGRNTDRRSIDAAALAVRILGRTKARPIFRDLVEYASLWLDRRGDEVRAFQRPPTPDAAAIRRAGTISVARAEYLDDSFLTAHNDFASGVPTWLRELRSVLTAYKQAADGLNDTQTLLIEQQQMLWWLLSDTPPVAHGWSWAYQVAVELDELTRRLPGPRSAMQLFRRKAGSDSDWDAEVKEPLDGVVPWTRPFSPALSLLRGEESDLDAPLCAADAATAIYDELLLRRLGKT